MTLADVRCLSVGTTIYVMPENNRDAIRFHFRNHFESNHEFDVVVDSKTYYDSPEHIIDKVRLRWREQRSNGREGCAGWYNAQQIEADRNVAIARNEKLIYQLQSDGLCSYNDREIREFRKYGSAREALYAEGIKCELEDMKTKNISA